MLIVVTDHLFCDSPVNSQNTTLPPHAMRLTLHLATEGGPQFVLLLGSQRRRNRMTLRFLCLHSVWAMMFFVSPMLSSAFADEPGKADNVVAAEADKDHPLAWTFRYAQARSDYIRKNVRDYTCRLIKRERINGDLQSHQFINVKMRCEQKRDGQVEQPMAVFMQFLAPKILRDRRVLYVDGQNDGNMLIRKGGRSMKYLRLEFDPNGRAARRESNYPITDVGFDKIIERLLERVSSDIKNDPTAANTQVSHFRNAKVGDRVCTHIQIVHPKRSEGMQFHKASLYVDDKLHVPIRLVVYDWPKSEDQKPPLMEEYIYVNLKLNVGLTDADFSESKLDTVANPANTISASLTQ